MRLVVLANGVSVAPRDRLGIGRPVISACHSISVGFDVAPIGRTAFAFPALTYFSEAPVHPTAYLTLFPVGRTMRANLFVYRKMDDPWLRQMRRAPVDALDACLPQPRNTIGDYSIGGGYQDPPRRSLCQFRLSPGRRRIGRRCIRFAMPGQRYGNRQSVHRCHPALQCPYSTPAGDGRRGRG